MRIAFTRSGGLAAMPGLQVRGTVTLEPSGGEVTSDSGYCRPLDPAESASLLKDAEGARLAAVAHPTAGDPRARDAYHFSINIDFANGLHAALRCRGGAAPTDPPAIARLVEWVSHEADAIARQRLTSG